MRRYEFVPSLNWLQNSELNLARVKQCVKLGGHNVPADKVITRLLRTRQYIKQALPLADMAQFYDNSSQQQPFLPIAQLNQGLLSIQKTPLPVRAETMLSRYL